MEYVEGKELIMEDVLSIRKAMTQVELQYELKNLNDFIEKNNVEKKGNLIMTHYGVVSVDNQQVIDTEILLPVSIEKCMVEKYKIKKKFILKNAIYMQYIGHPNDLEGEVNKMMQYINEKKIQSITSLYTEHITELNSSSRICVNCYIGVSDNVL